MRVGDLVWACIFNRKNTTITHRIMSIIVRFDRHVPNICFVIPVNSAKQHKWNIGKLRKVK